METPLIVLNIILVVTIVLIVFYILRRNKTSGTQSESTALLNQMNALRNDLREVTKEQRSEVKEHLDKMHDRIMKNMSDSAKVMQSTTKEITQLKETNKQVLQFSKQLENLEKILRNPKKRGILGEYWLETLLGQVLQPEQYDMQHQLGTDEETGSKLIPDAVLFVNDMTIPIDAKFSLDNYNKLADESDPERRQELERRFKSDVKRRIDETSKYVQPQLGTTNFAFMFIPAEGVYNNLITSSVGAVKVNSRNLIEYAFEKKVLIVSPTPFFAYLQTVLLGLKALKIEESVEKIQKEAEKLMRHIRAYEVNHNKVGKHLRTTMRAFNRSSKELKKIDKDIYRITEGEAGRELEPDRLNASRTEVDE